MKKYGIIFLVVLFMAVLAAAVGCGGGKENASLTKIEIAQAPSKVVYEIGESLSAEGGKLTLIYSDGKETVADMTADMLSADLSSAGEKTVTVTYTAEGKTFRAEYTVTVNATAETAVLSEIIVETGKADYFEGEEFTLSGYTVILVMSDGTEQTVPLTEEYLETLPDMDSIGEQKINVSYTYEGVTKTDYFYVNVQAIEVESIEFVGTERPVASYTEGDALDLNGAKIRTVRNNHTYGQEILLTEDMLDTSELDMGSAGTYTVVIRYEGCELSFTVTVNERSFAADISFDRSDPNDVTVGIQKAVTSVTLDAQPLDGSVFSYTNGVLKINASAFDGCETGDHWISAATSEGAVDIRVTVADKVIRTATDLGAVRTNLNGYYVLGNDVDLAGINFLSIGTSALDITADGTSVVLSHNVALDGREGVPFTGTFDGKGFAFVNLDIHNSDEKPSYGSSDNFGRSLFGFIGEEGVVRNLCIRGASVDASHSSAFVASVNAGLVENVLIESGTLYSHYGHGAAIVAVNAGTVQNCVNLVAAYADRNNGSKDLPAVAEPAGGKAQNIYSIAAGDGAFSKTEAQLKDPATYALSGTVWILESGKFPALANNGFVSLSVEILSGAKFIEGMALDRSKFSVTGMRRFGTEPESIDVSLLEIIGYEDTVGTHTLTFALGTLSVTKQIEVVAKSVSAIRMAVLPKTVFTVGESFTFEGAKIEVSYDNGSTQTITVNESMVDASAVKMDIAGKYSVAVSYESASTEYEINVTAATVTSISIKKDLTNKTYFSGDTIDFASMEIEVNWSDGSVTYVSGDEADPRYTDATGEQTVTFTYGGQTASTTVTLLAAPQSFRYIPNEGAKIAADGNGNADWFANGEFMVTYSDDSTQAVDAGQASVVASVSGCGRNVTVRLSLTISSRTLDADVTLDVLYKLITSAEQLQEIGERLDGAYLLGKDIDLSGIADFISIGTAALDVIPDDGTYVVLTHNTAYDGREGIPFTGIFDGNGYTISDLSTKPAGAYSEQGSFAHSLFGMIGETGEVRNFTLSGANIDGANLAFVAGVNSGVIENVRIASDCRLYANWGNGAAFALLNTGTVRNCVCERAELEKSDNATKPLAAVKTNAEGTIDNVFLASDGTLSTDPSAYGELDGNIWYCHDGFTPRLKNDNFAMFVKTFSELPLGAEGEIELVDLSVPLENYPTNLHIWGTEGKITAEKRGDKWYLIQHGTAEGDTFTVGLGVHYMDGNGTYPDKFTFTIVRASATELTFKSNSKPQYVEGQAFDLSAVTLVAVLTDGTEQDVHPESVSGYDKDAIGQQTVTLHYRGKTVTIDITVVKKEAASITVTAPNNLVYSVGQEVSLSGGYLQVLYNDGSVGGQIELTSEMIEGFDTLTASEGTVTVTVSYLGCSDTFEITVLSEEVTVTHVTAEGALTRNEFFAGEAVQEKHLENLSFRIQYSDGQEAVMRAGLDMLSSAELTAGQAELVFMVGGSPVSVPVTVYGTPVSFAVTPLVSSVVYEKGTAIDYTQYAEFSADCGTGSVVLGEALVKELVTASEAGYGASAITFTLGTLTATEDFDLYYAVSDAESWAAINDDLGAWYALVNDLSFADGGFVLVASGAKIYSANYEGYIVDPDASSGLFTGRFDGNGYTISDISYEDFTYEAPSFAASLFGGIGVGGVVRNFTAENISFGCANFAAAISSMNKGRIENVLVRNCIIQNKHNSGAALVWQNYGAIENAVLYNVTMKANGTSAGRIAALCYKNNQPGTIANVYLWNINYVSSNDASVNDAMTDANLYGSSSSWKDGVTNSGFRTEDFLKGAENYSGWDSTVWNIVQGEFPSMHAGFFTNRPKE